MGQNVKIYRERDEKLIRWAKMRKMKRRGEKRSRRREERRGEKERRGEESLKKSQKVKIYRERDKKLTR